MLNTYNISSCFNSFVILSKSVYSIGLLFNDLFNNNLI